MASCDRCYRSEGRKFKAVLVASGRRIRYEGDSTWYQPLDWKTVDDGPCPECKGTGVEPAKTEANS